MIFKKIAYIINNVHLFNYMQIILIYEEKKIMLITVSKVNQALLIY